MTALIGALVGAGVWLVGRGLLRRPVPLLRALREYREAVLPDGEADGDHPADWRHRAERRALRVVEALGFDLGTLGADLRIVGRSPSQHAFAKLAGTLLAAGALAVAGFGARLVGLAPPVWLVGLLVVLGALGGYVGADGALRKKATERRDQFLRALSAYMDLVKILLAGGSHSDGALYQAAAVGSGWVFDELKAAMDWSRVNGRPPSAGFQRLADEIDVPDVEELAATIRLTAEQGASPADALACKAEMLSALELANVRMKADSTTERMSIPTVVVAIAFVMFVGYPALSSLMELL
ncbi:MAG: hypothetical protein OXH20_00790 [bacterium]|nr:hypothetical protein [bacterium]MDE0668042.1 hypothetical protein [bacterium]MXZ30918.1 hypothetical protein [Acidimicrobiia bacterium]MYB24397.1 hypothetical protein [Acidimicrobiia bacterium]MYJ14451.1 hypothetical protein [Acidimicrobiia bacterium]